MFDRILVPTDGSDVAATAAARAVDLAAAVGADLLVLHVIDAEAIGFVEPSDLDLDEVRTSLRREGERATDAVAELAREGGVPVETAVRVGVPAETIRRVAVETGADLVVMGTHGRGGVGRFVLGSVTERVLRGSAIPVLAVPPAGAAPVTDPERAAERALAAAAEAGFEEATLREEPYRERTTWVVPLDVADAGRVNVHVDATSGAARTARLG